jgi:hypothetical protein
VLLHLNRLPDADDLSDVLRADGHPLTNMPARAEIVVAAGPFPTFAVAPSATILQLGGSLRLPTGSHVPTPVLDNRFRPTPAAEVLGVDLTATATLLIDPPRTAIVGAGTDVVPLVSNAHGQHLALLFPHDRQGWHWWVHADALDALPWIDAAIEHRRVTQLQRVGVGLGIGA